MEKKNNSEILNHCIRLPEYIFKIDNCVKPPYFNTNLMCFKPACENGTHLLVLWTRHLSQLGTRAAPTRLSCQLRSSNKSLFCFVKSELPVPRVNVQIVPGRTYRSWVARFGPKLKNPRIYPIWGQFDPLWVQIWPPRCGQMGHWAVRLTYIGPNWDFF